MNETYRDTYHLSAHEMDELRESLFWGCAETNNLSAEEQLSVNLAFCSAQISADIVHHAFQGYVFCDEDFIR